MREATLGAFDGQLAKEIVAAYLALSSSRRPLLATAIDRFDRAMSRRDPGDAAIELSTALETFLGDESSELVWKVSLRAVLMGQETLEERKRLRAAFYAGL